jgi:deoxyribose-phosphate aldolase
MGLTRSELARMVDHTLLKPEATAAQVAALCAEATELGVHAVCISPSFLPLATGLLGPGTAVCTVVGFPSGKHHAAIKAAEAARAVAEGADEVDMVVDVGAIRAGSWRVTERELRAVREVTEGKVLKVILETAALRDDEIVRASVTCKEAGVDFVKTSTGFHPSGGASTHAVSLMATTVGATMGVKASGGIRTAGAALAMITAGATRLGLSATREVLDGLAAAEAPAGPEAGGARAEGAGAASPGAGAAGGRGAGAAAGAAGRAGAGDPEGDAEGHGY